MKFFFSSSKNVNIPHLIKTVVIPFGVKLNATVNFRKNVIFFSFMTLAAADKYPIVVVVVRQNAIPTFVILMAAANLWQ